MCDLLRDKKVAFIYHPHVINGLRPVRGRLGDEYKDGTVAWAEREPNAAASEPAAGQ